MQRYGGSKTLAPDHYETDLRKRHCRANGRQLSKSNAVCQSHRIKCEADDRSGYVALAVASPDNVQCKEIETGHADREKNMVEFALGALQLLLSVIQEATQKL